MADRKIALSRRAFLSGSALAATVAALGGSANGARASTRPNVIVLYADDLGTLDLGCYGAEDLETPNLDRLASEGVRFSQFYAASCICSPSRAALLTGRYPQRAGVPGNTQSRPERFEEHGGLPDSEVTIAELLRENGYRTGHFGKWHLGAQPGPNGHGFDESEGFLGGCIDKWSHFNYGGMPWGAYPQRHDWYRNGEEYWATGRHAGDIIADESTRFMNAGSDKPFFIYAAFGTPHYPMQPKNEWMRYYKHLEEPRRVYAASVSTLDEQIGRILTALDDSGLAENTIVVFQSDHGHSTEERNNFGGGFSGPYRGAKKSFFEGGIRVPAIVRYPGHVPAGETRDQWCTGCDWFPAIAEWCKTALPERTIDGRSLVNVIDDTKAEPPHDLWHWQLGNRWLVRQNDWKLLMNPIDSSDGRNHEDINGPFLVNLREDRSEKANLADKFPERVQAMTDLHELWIADLRKD